jgi:hypothetical protein
MIGFIETGMFMTIGVSGRSKVPVMRQVVAIVNAGDGTDRSENQKVVPEIIATDVREKTAMHAVMGNDEECVVAIADNGNCQENDNPSGTKRNTEKGKKDGKPTKRKIEYGTFWAEN